MQRRSWRSGDGIGCMGWMHVWVATSGCESCMLGCSGDLVLAQLGYVEMAKWM